MVIPNLIVIPAKAGIQSLSMGHGFRVCALLCPE